MALLGPAEVRSLAAELDVRPTKQLGQNFVHDANTVRRIVASAGVGGADTVLEVGPGLGSLTLALLDVADAVIAVEIDPKLAGRLPQTAAERAPSRAGQLTVVEFDALRVKASDIPGAPSALVANLPYNVAVPVLIHLFSELPSLRTALVMVQAEVADRLAADPGSKVYGIPSVKAGFFGTVKRAGSVGRSVFWPVPKVESGLVRLDRYPEPPWSMDDKHRRRLRRRRRCFRAAPQDTARRLERLGGFARDRRAPPPRSRHRPLGARGNPRCRSFRQAGRYAGLIWHPCFSA